MRGVERGFYFMEYNGFRLEVGEVSVLTLDQPRVNTFSTPVIENFIGALEMLKEKKEVKVLVITGEGKTFLAGADIKELSGFDPEDAKRFAELIHRALKFVEVFPRPVIAAVNGFALGGGCELVLACDIVIASEAAVFGQPEINIGIIPGAGGTQRLPPRVGKIRAKELIFTGRMVPAGEALAIGLVNKVVAGEKLLEEVTALARVIASKPVQCIERCKTLIDSGTPAKEIEAFARMFTYEDRKRLMGDFLKKKR
jgi:enoyl-CoA hydratase